MTKIKLCGMMEEKDILCVNKLNPDYIGFVFYEKSKRYRNIDHFKHLKSLLNPKIKAVGVFVNSDCRDIIDIQKSGIIDIIQLHGSETEEDIERLHDKLNINIIKAFGIKSSADIEKANASSADMVLLDTPGGGTGQTFDHNLLKDMDRDFFLAGGLNPKNVQNAIKSFLPYDIYGVDTSSGIETNGVKDPDKMAAFIKAVRG